MAERAVANAKASEAKKTFPNSSKQNVGFNSPGSPADIILQLQRAAGNQAVQKLIESGALQAKLKIGQPDDIYEQEADRVAEQVMSMPEPMVRRQAEEKEETVQAKFASDQIIPLVQRQSEEENENEGPVYVRDISGRVSSDLESSIRSMKGNGQSLPKTSREFFEPRFGYDFGKVRVHTGNEASGSARALNARAYTVGKDIVLGAGQYAPETVKGKRLLAHELTHVIQQEATHRVNPSLQMDLEKVPSRFLPIVRSAVGDFIVSQARSRMGNPYIRQAYSSRIPWFFSPNNRLAGWTSKNDIMEADRSNRRVGNALRWMKSSMFRAMPALGRELENFPSDEGVVWWGAGVYTCNVFVFDALYSAGLNPPIAGNTHYYSPGRIFNRSGSLRSYFADVSAENIQPGDVFATHGHTEIITSASSEHTSRRGRRTVTVRTFSSIGAGKDGIGVEENSGIRTGGKRFRRVATEALRTHTGVA